MSNKSSMNEPGPEGAGQTFRASIKAARQRQRYTWLFSLAWLAAVFGVALYVRSQTRDLQQRQASLERDMRDAVTYTVSGMSGVREQVYALQGSLERRASHTKQNLSPLEIESYALLLAQAQVDRQPLTATEVELLETERNKTRPRETVQGRYLKGSSLTETDPSSAITILTSALQMDPLYEPARAALGKSYSWAGRNPEALEELTKAIKLNPDRPSSYAERCWVLMALDRAEEAVRDCDQAAKLDSGYWPPYHYRAFAEYRLNKDGPAEEDWRKSAMLRANPADSLENLGLIYLRRGDLQKALDNAQIISLLDSGSAWNWLFLSISLDRLGRTDQAHEAQQMWKKLKSDDDVRILTFLLPAELRRFLTAG